MSANSSEIMPSLVLVTGANGFIGSMAVKMLLERGYKVRATVRDASDETKTNDLRLLLPHADTHLELLSLDLLGPQESFVAAMQGVEWCFHMAAPVTLQNFKDESIMIRPTVEGTLSLLRAARQVRSVKKFILTSSSCTIEQGHTSETRDPNRPFTEEDWSNLQGPGLNAYDKSKTLAERAAWDFMDEHKPLHFTLSSINPTYVIGPVAVSQIRSSCELVARPMRAIDPESLNIWLRFVDVREVVEAHIQAARREEAAGKRFILSNSEDGEMFMPQMVEILGEEFRRMGYTLRSWIIPTWIVWVISLFDSDVASVYHLLNDDSRRYDNSASKTILKLKYRPVRETIMDAAHSMIQQGLIKKKPGYYYQRAELAR